VLTENDDVCQIAQIYNRRFVSGADSGLRGEMFSWLEEIYTTSRCGLQGRYRVLVWEVRNEVEAQKQAARACTYNPVNCSQHCNL
jgi:hypothetical protein